MISSPDCPPILEPPSCDLKHSWHRLIIPKMLGFTTHFLEASVLHKRESERPVGMSFGASNKTIANHAGSNDEGETAHVGISFKLS